MFPNIAPLMMQVATHPLMPLPVALPILGAFAISRPETLIQAGLVGARCTQRFRLEQLDSLSALPNAIPYTYKVAIPLSQECQSDINVWIAVILIAGAVVGVIALGASPVLGRPSTSARILSKRSPRYRRATPSQEVARCLVARIAFASTKLAVRSRGNA